MFWLLFLLLVPLRTSGQATDMSDTLFYYSDFSYSLADIDSLLLQSPQVVLLSEQIKARNEKDSFLRSLSFHLTYSPFEGLVPDSRQVGFGFTLPLGKLFQDSMNLDKAELESALSALRVKARELMKQREELLTEMELEIQRYKTALLKLQKTEIALSINQASSDELLQAQDSLAELLASIKKKKLEIHFVEDQLEALVGKL